MPFAVTRKLFSFLDINAKLKAIWDLIQPLETDLGYTGDLEDANGIVFTVVKGRITGVTPP